MEDINYEMENIQQTNNEIVNNDAATGTETAEKKKLSVGEWGILVSAGVGAVTIAVKTFKFIKKQFIVGKSRYNSMVERLEQAAAVKNDPGAKDAPTEEKPETNKKDKKD